MDQATNLKVMVVGGGGREHALCWKLAQSDAVAQIYCAPGNGGTAGESKTENADIAVMDFDGIAAFCKSRKIDLVVVGPDDPIAAGLVDHLEAEGIRAFGPSKRLARLEASKAFAKQFMVDHQMPTARFLVTDNLQDAADAVREHPWARVVKVDGLALGKGVFVCDTEDEAVDAVNSIFRERKFGDAGKRVVIEERVSGEEMSLLLFCDGKRVVAMPPLQDHKRRFDGDRGPNTGGMGAFSPVELYRHCHEEIDKQVLEPIRKAMKNRQFDYKGVLFIGLMVETRKIENGKVYQPYVLEFNARFGDPETQAIMPLLEADLLKILWACTEGKLAEVPIEWGRGASCCVVACADSYPESSSKGEQITLSAQPTDTMVFQAGTKLDGKKLVTNGGRVLAVTATGENLEDAVQKAYDGLEKVSFKGMAFRKDIAKRSAAACLSL
jgi:phosphoribosylamine---glycine ligase